MRVDSFSHETEDWIRYYLWAKEGKERKIYLPYQKQAESKESQFSNKGLFWIVWLVVSNKTKPKNFFRVRSNF